MTISHTPGPWVFPTDAKDDSRIISTEKNGYEIGEVYVWEDVPAESKANARLISAAPELLEALRGLDEAYCRAGTNLTRDERTEDRKRLIAARAAIAKATGKTQ